MRLLFFRFTIIPVVVVSVLLFAFPFFCMRNLFASALNEEMVLHKFLLALA